VKQAHPTFSAAQLHAHLLTMGREPGPLAPDPQRGAGNLWLNPPLAGPPFVTTGSEVALANADGSHATDVTVGAGASTAVLSPAGDKIAYASAKDGDYDIYVANADGSGEVNVTANTSNDGDPSWSSDGARLAFVSDRDGNNEIYVMNADGTAQTRLTNWAQEDRDPDFGVGDTKITFVRNPLTDGFVRWDVFTMNADGTGPVNLTDGNPGPSQADPVYSPDGTKIVFDAQSASQGSLIGIYVMNADGSSKTQLTTNATQDHDPAWTADGTRIVFARADATGSGFWDLYAIDPDGTDLLRMSNSRQRSERHPGQAGSASVPPLLAAPPAISGTARIGSYLQATAGSWVGGSPLSSIYQWQRCDGSGSACSPISGATDLFYRLVDADLGSRLRVSLSTSNTSGSKSVTSAASPVVSAAPPQAMALPMIGAGVTLAVGEGVFGTTGVWSGSPALALYWLRCDEFGGFCEAASGSGGQIYFVGPADAGHTLRLAVAATTSGGTTVATSLATGVVPGGGGGGGGSGGGGGGQPADLELTKTANAATAGVGETILYRLQARVKNFQLTSGASQVLVTDTLPAGVELVSTKVNRGPGCTGTTTVTCNLDFLSGQIVGEVEIVARAAQSGSLVNTATVAAAQSDPDRSNNTASVTVTVRGPERQPSGPTTAKPISAKKGVTKRGTAKSNLLRGTGLADRLFGLAGDDRLFGLAGSDRLFGGPGNDLLDGGPGSDVLDAGAGNDLLRVRDGSSDTVLCGPGRDTVRADRRDKVARSCETVKRA
jgi:uncharacterized repeat protein (TIGR01451 family)